MSDAFGGQHREWDNRTVSEDGGPRRIRYNLAESPVAVLGRRRDKEGQPFLSEELVEAAVSHIEVERARLFEAAASGPVAPGVDAAEQAIDAYWALLHEIPFIAFAELEAAARTDAMLRARLANAQSAFDHNQVGDRFLALAQAGGDPRFQTSRDLGRFLLEGLARGAMTFDEQARKERLLTVVKRAVRVLNRKGDVQELWPD